MSRYWIEQRVALTTTGDESTWTWSDWGSPVTTGNITVTTMIGLREGTYYQWRIAPLTEDQTFSTQWQELDLYGRRDPVPGFVRGEFSPSTTPTKTLATDFTFSIFNANATLNHGPFDARSSLGPLGVTRGEGHYGLVLVGDTNVQNCNASSICCDGYLELRCRLSCSAQARVRPAYLNTIALWADADDLAGNDNGAWLCVCLCLCLCLFGCASLHVWLWLWLHAWLCEWCLARLTKHECTCTVEGEVPRPPTSFPNGITVGPTEMLNRKPAVGCGPALRLTSSRAKQSGAAWYNRKMQVREGFDTSFTFRLSDPSTHCKFLDDAYTHCRYDTVAPLMPATPKLTLGGACRGCVALCVAGPVAAMGSRSWCKTRHPLRWVLKAWSSATAASKTRWPSSSTHGTTRRRWIRWRTT